MLHPKYGWEKISAKSWDQLPEHLQAIFVKGLIEDWPTMSRMDREYVMFQDPEAVKAAGLWPEGGVLPEKSRKRVKAPTLEEHIAEAAEKHGWVKEDWRPWGRLSDVEQLHLYTILKDEWQELSPEEREWVMFQDPDAVKELGRWSIDELEPDD